MSNATPPPTTPIATPPAVEPEKPMAPKFDAFHPDMPEIPGVPRPRKLRQLTDQERLLQFGGIGLGVILIGVAFLWWFKSMSRPVAQSVAPAPSVAEPAESSPPPTSSLPAIPTGPTVAATIEEISKPWDAKQFVFVNPQTYERVDAMVVRLPGSGLWAFSLQEPYGHCALEYVTDLRRLASQYGFRSAHPMVANTCTNTLYDPLKLGPLGNDVWVRGEVVKGTGLRPPVSINVVIKGHSVIADRIE